MSAGVSRRRKRVVAVACLALLTGLSFLSARRRLLPYTGQVTQSPSGRANGQLLTADGAETGAQRVRAEDGTASPVSDRRNLPACHRSHNRVNPMQRLDVQDVRSRFRLSKFVRNEASSGDSSASSSQPTVCQFSAVPNSNHFAHAMQQLYGCWSLSASKAALAFATHDGDAGRIDPAEETAGNSTGMILLIPPSLQKKFHRHPFLHGYLQGLVASRELLHGTTAPTKTKTTTTAAVIMSRDEYIRQQQQQKRNRRVGSDTDRNVNGDNAGGDIVSINVQDIGGYVLERADDLRMLFGRNGTRDQSSKEACQGRAPQITILNRRRSKGRSIVNAEELASAIQERYLSSFTNITDGVPASAGGSNDNRTAVQITYFEDATFHQQLDTFRRTDILLSPHGAQLTGLPFLGTTRCSTVLEFFPRGYALPSFYGSLAVGADRRYRYVYLSDGDRSVEEAKTQVQRVQARSANLCPTTADVLSYVQELISDWHRCCASLQRQRSVLQRR